MNIKKSLLRAGTQYRVREKKLINLNYRESSVPGRISFSLQFVT